jgi:hypothetical protein
MKLKLDDSSYIEVKEDKVKNKAKVSIKTKADNRSILITAELDEEQIVKIISELVSIKVNLYGKE